MKMTLNQRSAAWSRIVPLELLAGLFMIPASHLAAQQANPPAIATQDRNSAIIAPAVPCDLSKMGSPYIPVDSFVYPAVMRLYSLGFLDTVYLGMRPWTRSSLSHMLEQAGARIQDASFGPATDEAEGIYEALSHELRHDTEGPCGDHKGTSRVESIYSVARGISGTPLRDSYHLGATIINDYGRPYASGFNNFTGASGYASAGRFAFYARVEFHGTPSSPGYSSALASQLAADDLTTDYFNINCLLSGVSCVPLPTKFQTTIPVGPISSVTNARLLEAYVSYQYLNHIISFGKEDEWQGPGLGGAMSYSNNAQNIYAFHINRIEPLTVPLLSRLTGPFRYEFLVGPLRGHTFPINPWVHVEKVSMRPTKNLEIGFERTAIWGGEGHTPITFKSFLRSFFSTSSPTNGDKLGPRDPGARFAAFDFSYRLPFVRNWLTVYSDSEVHDDVSPADAPRRASWRPGIYLSHVPGLPKVDIRVEGISTDPPVRNSEGGAFMYYETIEKQGYTNQGQLFGDWIGREDKGGQAWITYHLKGDQWMQVSIRNQKAAKDFIPGGTTLNDVNFQVVKRIGRDFQVDGKFQFEHWKAPIYLSGQQTVTNTTIQLTWFPERKVSF